MVPGEGNDEEGKEEDAGTGRAELQNQALPFSAITASTQHATTPHLAAETLLCPPRKSLQT